MTGTPARRPAMRASIAPDTNPRKKKRLALGGFGVLATLRLVSKGHSGKDYSLTTNHTKPPSAASLCSAATKGVANAGSHSTAATACGKGMPGVTAAWVQGEIGSVRSVPG